jgi:CRISPR-associated endoribonuclease Cas6
MPCRSRTPILAWSADTELVGITLILQPQADILAPTHYTTQLHSWFLDQIRRIDPHLSAYLHDGQSEKAFSLSSLSGDIQSQGRTLHFRHDCTYEWSIAALSKSVCEGLQQWLTHPPEVMQLHSGHLTILRWDIRLPATNYETVWETAIDSSHLEQGCLTFATPTSFRKRSNHLPLPMPENVFHSYLRRWNDFAPIAVEQARFLDWVNECVVILRHEIRSQKTQAGKQGSVTGFVGSVQFGLTPKAKFNPDYVQLFYALIACAPYFGTGHKVTFGLGQTRHGWFDQAVSDRRAEPISNAVMERDRRTRPPVVERSKFSSGRTDESKLKQVTQDDSVLPEDTHRTRPRVAEVSEAIANPTQLTDEPTNEQIRNKRESELKEFFLSRKKRQGGERAEKAAALWATILVGQEFGATLKEIAESLELPYETVRRYASRAHQELSRTE